MNQSVTHSLPIVATDDPLVLFHAWFAEAAAREPLPEAVGLATVAHNGRPSLRMVLLKDASHAGFVFYTNAHSRKGEDIAANPFGALCLYWKSLGRQIRIEGAIAAASAAEADAYFAARPRESQLAAWASLQSQLLPQRSVLLDRMRSAELRYEGGPVPRPPHWVGYRLAPDLIEFWQDVPNRLHDRLAYERDGSTWRTWRLYP